tara:strand:- start:151 stop:312 length:162 start_codon:yes stop_codon:yes gene_type:complete
MIEEHIMTQSKIWGLVALGELGAFNLNDNAQAFMYICAGLASLAAAYKTCNKK